MKLEFTVNLEQNDGGYDIFCPDVPGVCSWGETEDEAMNNMVEALNQHLMCLIETDKPLPAAVVSQVKRQSETLLRETVSQSERDLGDFVDVGVAVAA